MNQQLSPRELAYCGLFGAAGMLLPVLFHVIHLGHIFMPMYLPLVLCAFFVSPIPAATTGLVIPLLSGALTGMPPFYPPTAVFMSLELAITAALISYLSRRFPHWNTYGILIPVLLFGRILYVGLVYCFSFVIQLPAAFMAGLSFIKGWPGILLMILVIPPLVHIRHILRLGGKEFSNE